MQVPHKHSAEATACTIHHGYNFRHAPPSVYASMSVEVATSPPSLQRVTHPMQSLKHIHRMDTTIVATFLTTVTCSRFPLLGY